VNGLAAFMNVLAAFLKGLTPIAKVLVHF